MTNDDMFLWQRRPEGTGGGPDDRWCARWTADHSFGTMVSVRSVGFWSGWCQHDRNPNPKIEPTTHWVSLPTPVAPIPVPVRRLVRAARGRWVSSPTAGVTVTGKMCPISAVWVSG